VVRLTAVRLRRDFYQVVEKCSGMLRRAQHARIFLSDSKIIPLTLNLSKDPNTFFNKLLEVGSRHENFAELP
jgi:hypothetical protein